jgi:predicted nuclease with RNAse H fold
MVVGVDVSERRGLDVVALGPGPVLLYPPLRRQTPAELGRWLVERRPAIVAIDSPPGWGSAGGSRDSERALAALGLPCFRTPSDPQRRQHAFYNWMRVGHEAFAAAARAGYPCYRGGPSALGCALEVFPHASAVALAGSRPPPGTSRRCTAKRVWRTAVLQRAGLDTSELSSLDAVDAALAALTALFVARGDHWFAVGDPAEGLIVLPGIRPDGPFPKWLSGQPLTESSSALHFHGTAAQ